MNTIRQENIRELIERNRVVTTKELQALCPEVSFMTIHRDLDVLIAPYPYVTTRIGWQSVERFAPKAVVLVHMPSRENDPDGIWTMVNRGVETYRDVPVCVPGLGETVLLF